MGVPGVQDLPRLRREPGRALPPAGCPCAARAPKHRTVPLRVHVAPQREGRRRTPVPPARPAVPVVPLRAAVVPLEAADRRPRRRGVGDRCDHPRGMPRTGAGPVGMFPRRHAGYIGAGRIGPAEEPAPQEDFVEGNVPFPVGFRTRGCPEMSNHAKNPVSGNEYAVFAAAISSAARTPGCSTSSMIRHPAASSASCPPMA